MKNITDEELATALMMHGTIRATATALDITEKTVYNRMKSETFKAVYSSARRELMERNTSDLQVKLSAAINEVDQIAHDKSVTPQTRLNACECIMRNCLKLNEQYEIINRIERLEQMQETKVDEVNNNVDAEICKALETHRTSNSQSENGQADT